MPCKYKISYERKKCRERREARALSAGAWGFAPRSGELPFARLATCPRATIFSENGLFLSFYRSLSLFQDEYLDEQGSSRPAIEPLGS